MVEPLSERDQVALGILHKHPRSQALQERAARELLELTPTRYRQLLLAIAQSEAGWAHDPILCKRILRLAGRRHAA